jgi:hypothetical protein
MRRSAVTLSSHADVGLLLLLRVRGLITALLVWRVNMFIGQHAVRVVCGTVFKRRFVPFEVRPELPEKWNPSRHDSEAK